MIGAVLKKLAGEYGLTIENGVAYGMLKGCLVTLDEAKNGRTLSIYAGPAAQEGNDPENPEPASSVIDAIWTQVSSVKKYGMLGRGNNLPPVSFAAGGSVVQVRFGSDQKGAEGMRAFIEEILPSLAQLTEPDRCFQCGQLTTGDVRMALAPGGYVLPMHEGCALDIQDSMKAAEKKSHPFLGILGGFLGAMLGGIVWMLVGMLGYMASIVGFVIAFLANKGYDLMGGKKGALKVITLVICTLLAVAVGNMGNEIYGIHEVYQEEAALYDASEIISEGEFIALVLEDVMQDSETLLLIGKDIAMGWFFALLGCFGMLRMAAGEKKNASLRMMSK